MRYRLIAPDWLLEEGRGLSKIVEGEFTDEQVQSYNKQGYNVYWFPNYPSVDVEGWADGTHIDTWEWVFVDMDLKDGVYESKNSFEVMLKFELEIPPTMIVDSGNGIHAYWRVTDLDAMSYLRLSRRLLRRFNTDHRVGKLIQLMRLPGTLNTKDKSSFKECLVVQADGPEYTSEQLDKALPRITPEDEDFCLRHYEATYEIKSEITVNDKPPLKWSKLLKESQEAKELFAGDVQDRSRADFRLTHILHAEGFTRDEAMSVLVNCKKALERAPNHRINYAANLVDKVFSFEEQPATRALLSSSVKDILRRKKSVLDSSNRVPCHPMFDGTEHGFRLTEVLGLVGGAGSGKTTLALNYFWHFVKRNPDFIHLFVSLEQPEEEIAIRWDKICQGDERLYEKVHVLGNYEEDGSYRHLSLGEIEDHVLTLEASTGCKVACVVIDHIGILNKKTKDGENQGLMDICHAMKAFAIKTKTFLVMQSQTNREKAGIGDLELSKDASYGTTLFEWYVDFLVTTWQPLKRVYDTAPEMCCSAYKYCKIRKKNILKDKIKEDVVYALKFDVATEQLRPMTSAEEQRYEVLNKQATALRNKDRKSDPTKVTKIDWVNENDRETPSNKD
jgi:ABC-type dipeptide/oligopeptide/nickel transport system ATPase component